MLVTGGTPRKLRDVNVAAFQDDPEVRVFIGQIQAAGQAVTLTAGRRAVFLEQAFVPAMNWQALKRCHRIGQHRPVLGEVLVVPGSIDEAVQALLVRKAHDIASLGRRHDPARRRAPARAPSRRAATRAEACTKSIELMRSAAHAHAPQRAASFDALFGTVAHEVLACACAWSAPARATAVILEGEQVPVTDTMRAMVQMALDETARRLPGRKLLIEARIDLPWGRIWGFVDVATVDLPLTLLDLKTGFHQVAPTSDQVGSICSRCNCA